MSRFSSYLRNQAALQPGRRPYTIRVSPGQYAELCAEQGWTDHPGAKFLFVSVLGAHPIERIECRVQATGDNVILCAREDLFAEVERDTGVELVSLANSVTSVPDNVGCCEIVSVGELVTNVKVGDIAFIDFFSVKQGYVLANEENYVAGSDAFMATFDPIKQEVLPLDNYVVTRRATDRFKVALTGTDRVEVLDYILTDGIVSGRTSQGTPSTHTLYQEVVRVGRITNRPRAGVMTKAESALLECMMRTSNFGPVDWEEVEHRLTQAVRDERANGRESDIQPGELVAFCKEVGTPVRVRGEFQYLIPYNSVLASIDDAAILADAIAAGRAGKLARVA